MSKKTRLLDNNTPRTDGQIRAHTIGELKPLSGRILIADYDPQWPELFEREIEEIIARARVARK